MIVLLAIVPCDSLLTICLNKFSSEWTREHATHNCPWVKTGVLRSTPTRINVCPWALLMVMAYASLTRNCKRHNLKGTLTASLVFRVMRGKKCMVPR